MFRPIFRAISEKLNYRPIRQCLPLVHKKLNSTSCESHPDKVFITTPIFYVNDVPHIGHLYTAVIGDALARWNRIKGKNVLYSTGTDEHGLKIQQAASKRDLQPIKLCDEHSNSFKSVFNMADIAFDDFIRTTDKRHAQVVAEFWTKLQDNGYIYKGSYEGWYCVSDEAFLTDNDVCDSVDSKTGEQVKVSKESGHRVEWMTEENYMFRLSKMGDELIKWLDTNPIHPPNFRPMVRRWVDDGLEDLSVSRLRERLSWGLPVPNDPSHTVYVWLDALVNYLTVAKEDFWPADCHIVGKDILRFHAIYWPAFLLAANLPPPKSILCHSHWMKDHQKMSKSLKNVIDPIKEIQTFSTDGVRYFLLKEGVAHSDGSYSSKKVKEYINADLVNTLGNLMNRCIAPSLNPDQIFPPFNQALFEKRTQPDFQDILDNLKDLPDKVDNYYSNYEFYKGLDCIFEQLRQTNGYMQAHEPWTLKGVEAEKEWLNSILHVSLSTLHVTSRLLEPVIPNLAQKIQRRLGSQGCINIHSYSGELGENEGVLIQRIK